MEEILQKPAHFHFLTLKSHVLNLRFLHYILRWENEKKYIKNCKIVSFFTFLTAHIRAEKCKMRIYGVKWNCEILWIWKKCLFPSFFLLFFQFLTSKHNVKNVNLENVILRLESEKSIFCAVFCRISYKKKVIFFVLRAKVKKK